MLKIGKFKIAGNRESLFSGKLKSDLGLSAFPLLSIPFQTENNTNHPNPIRSNFPTSENSISYFVANCQTHQTFDHITQKAFSLPEHEKTTDTLFSICLRLNGGKL
jgi:hypothetical protein